LGSSSFFDLLVKHDELEVELLLLHDLLFVLSLEGG